MNNNRHPEVYYNTYVVQGSGSNATLIYQNPEGLVVAGYQTLLVMFLVDIETLLSSPLRYSSSRNFIDFEVSEEDPFSPLV